MSFRKRNKIKLPAIPKEGDNVPNSNTQKPKVALQFDNDDEDEIQPTIKLKKGKRKKFVPNVSSSKPENDIQEDSSNTPNAVVSDKDAYGSLLKTKSKNNIVLNLEDESEIENIEVDNGDNYNEDDENNSILTSEQVRKIKEKKEAIRRKSGVKKEVEKERFSERNYAKLLTTEEKADLLDTYKDNGGIAKANEYKDIRNQESLIDDIVEDGRLALTDKERIKEQENRREMIEEAAMNEFTMGDHFENINEPFIDREYSPGSDSTYNLDNQGMFTDNYKLPNKKISKRPTLWQKNETLEGDELIDSELAKLSLKMKTEKIRYAMLESEKSKLVQNGKEILTQLLKLLEDK